MGRNQNMAQTNQVRKVVVTGCNGYVGNYLLKSIAKANPAVQCIGMSRSGKVRKGENETDKLENVSYKSGNCLKVDTFENELTDADAVVHAVGSLFESSDSERSLQALNRDTCINMARVLEVFAREDDSSRNFVMISSAKGPFF